MISYLDTSAAMKLLVEEAESAALAQYLHSRYGESEDGGLVASWLLHTELHCAANRHPESVSIDSVTLVLDSVTLVDITRGDLFTAGTLPGRLRSNDALHLAVALRVAADEVLTYDLDLAAASTGAGLAVTQPR